MSKKKLEVLKQAELTNNCPECFNQDLTLVFYQKHSHGKLFHRITPEVSHEIKCNKCNSLIYPVQWTDDIERIYDYYQKTVNPLRPSTRFTTLFYILVLLLISVVAGGIYLLVMS